MAQGELRELREKLEAQEREFENYRDQCRTLESFLEAEADKKEAEIVKLKEEAIKKEKVFKGLKLQNAALIAQVATLKNEQIRLAEGKGRHEEMASKLELMQQSRKKFQDQKLGLEEELRKMRQQKQSVNNDLWNQNKMLSEQLSRIRQLNQHIQQQMCFNTGRIEELQGQKLRQQTINQSLKQQLTASQQIIQQKTVKIEKLYTKKIPISDLPTSHKDKTAEKAFMKTPKVKQQGKMEGASQDKLLKYQDKIQRYEKQIKQLRERLKESPSKNSSPFIQKDEEDSYQFFSKIYIACLIVTKQYYTSPILEFSEQAKCIRLFKSARNGCFEKSLGVTKHKVDQISHESAAIVKQIADFVAKCPEECNHSILIYGVKKTNKKQLLSAIFTKLFNFLKNKVENPNSSDIEAVFIRKSGEEDSYVKEEVHTADAALELLQKISNLSEGQKSEKVSARKSDKPRVLYFSILVDDFSLSVATSSFTNIPYRQKEVVSTFYSNVLYSKLPDVLHPTYSQKYIILTLNPIVDLYEDCRNTLNVTLYKPLPPSNPKDFMMEGVDKELLNAMARKKLESYEKEIEQNLLKIERVESERQYFKSKFDELESRLKTLLSTHHGQSAYLKKSPILLSYEKLLKFVHAVQSKSGVSSSSGSDFLCPNLRLDLPDFQLNDSDDSSEAL